MFRRSLSIRSRILLLAAIAVASFSAAVAVAFLYHSGIEDSRRRFELQQQNVRTAQIHFKLQVQEWKNVLLRGEDRNDFKKHLTRFSTEHYTVQASLRALELGSPADLAAKIREAAAEHDRLHTRYITELGARSELDGADAHRIDGNVRGMDRSFDSRLESLVGHIAHEQDNYASQSGLQFEAGLVLIGLATALLVIGTSLFTSRVIGNVLRSVGTAIQTLARGNLAQAIVRTGGREQAAILAALARLRDSLIPVLARLGQEIKGTEHRALEIKQSSDGLSKSAESLAASSEEAAAAVEELSASHEHVVQSITVVEESSASFELSVKELTTQSSEALASVELLAGRGETIASETMEGAGRAGQVLTAMSAARENTKKIDGIMQVMYDLSERVNLLALNASIEAARAGEAGRGFAVVAEQISRMADNTAASIRDTEQLTRAIQGSVENAFSEVEIISQRFHSSAAGLGEVQDGIKSIEKGIVLQKKSTDRIAGAIQSLLHASETVKSAAEENRRASAELSALIQTNAKESEQILMRAQHLTEIAAALSENGTQLGHAIQHFSLPETGS